MPLRACFRTVFYARTDLRTASTFLFKCGGAARSCAFTPPSFFTVLSETLKTAKPLFPAGFTTAERPRDNAKLLLAIAELAGDKCAEQARAALDKLLREKHEPGWLELLLQELWSIFVKEGRKDVTSKQLLAQLTADPTSEWYEYGGPRGHRVTEREVAAILRKLHVRPHPIGEKRLRGYHRQDFLEKEIFQHFLGLDPLIRSSGAQPKKSRKKSRKKSG